jgi:hypothetical protein
MDMITNINWLAVLAGGVIYMVIGGLWYGPIAGKAWMQEVGLTEEEIKASGSPVGIMVKSFIAALVMSTGLAIILATSSLGGHGWLGGAITGLVLAVLVIGGGTFPNYAFESKSLRHFLIHLGNVTVAMVLIGAMMGAWR